MSKETLIMTRLGVGLCAITVIAGLIATLTGCGSSNRGPAAPTTLTGPTTPTTPTEPAYMISGVITAYRSGPVTGMNVGVYPYPYGPGAMTQTDAQGHYSLRGPSAQKVGIQISSPRDDYASAVKYDLESRDQVVNFVVHPTFRAPAAGGTVSGTITGDEFIAGDDVFGGRCTGMACKVVAFDCCSFAGPRVEVRLRWTDSSRQLALYFARGDIYFPPQSPPPPADRYCCSSELVATYAFNFDVDGRAIGFEQSAGGRPGPADAQPFELTVRPLP
jgi:hypothetical protein